MVVHFCILWRVEPSRNAEGSEMRDGGGGGKVSTEVLGLSNGKNGVSPEMT